jgi:hypothetical protein
MPLDWEDVKRRYDGGAKVPTVAGGKTLQVTGVDDGAVHIKTSLWSDSLAREHLELAVRLLEDGKLTRHPGHFAEQYRHNVADVRGTSAAHILKDLGHLD